MILLSACAVPEQEPFIRDPINEPLEAPKKDAARLTSPSPPEDPYQETSPLKDPVARPSTWLPGLSWHYQLSETIQLKDAEVYDIDLFDTPVNTLKTLHARGARVICYFSAGTYEEWRDDAQDFADSVLGNELEDWEGEKWLDISQFESFAVIMQHRLDLAKEKGCDAVEADNVDAYTQNSGFSLTYQDQLEYNKWLAREAHARGLVIGLKNNLEQVADLEPFFDFAINEQCFEYEECDLLLPFIQNNKAVFGVEYELDTKDFCEEANRLKFSWLKMEYSLDGNRISCQN